MTVGFPDFQAYANTTGLPIVDQPAFSLSNATPFSANGSISSYVSARMRVFPSGSARGCTATATYYSDAALTDAVGSYQWIVAAPSGLAVLIPNLGPYVRISVTTTTVGAFNCLIQFTPQSTSCSSPRYLAVGNEANMVNVSIPASTTQSVFLPFVAEGPGYWMVFPRDASAKLNVQVWEVGQNGGQSVKCDEQDAIAVPVNRQIFGANQVMGLFVTNTDGVSAHALDARLVIDGR
jgi:hypothetical protein